MNQLTLKTQMQEETTHVSNLFLDCYMPKANGEYVKVYLYLLRALQNPAMTLSVTVLADALDHTEGDILRALKYWEKQGILKLEYGKSKELKGIHLLELHTPASKEKKEAPAEPSTAKTARRSYSQNELAQFSTQAQCQQLLFVCEQYLKKTLSPSEIETLLYFYDQLHFSSDLIEYLVEYCVCKGSSSIHYIETVALAWAEAGISTVAQAKERTTTYTRGCFAIMKAFGINDRNPVDPELRYMEKWLTSYDFTLELVLEACRRTMERLHKPSFEYADQILKSWNKQKVHNIEDIKKLDQSHQKRVSKRAPVTVHSTGFSNFEQRNYDFDELERQLLQSQ